MDSSLQQSIISVVTSAIATAVTAIQAKYDNEMLSLREIIEKSLLVRELPSMTPPLDYDATMILPRRHILAATSYQKPQQNGGIRLTWDTSTSTLIGHTERVRQYRQEKTCSIRMSCSLYRVFKTSLLSKMLPLSRPTSSHLSEALPQNGTPLSSTTLTATRSIMTQA